MAQFFSGPVTRRRMLSGFASLAAAAMLHRDGYAGDGKWTPPDGKPHNLVRLMIRPDGLKPVLEDWENAVVWIVVRLVLKL